MEKKLFGKLVKSMKQAEQIVRGERRPSRVFRVDSANVKKLRTDNGLSQPRFAALLQVDAATLRDWERGIRDPIGPAKALLNAIRNDPKNVLKALAK